MSKVACAEPKSRFIKIQITDPKEEHRIWKAIMFSVHYGVEKKGLSL